MHRKKEKPKSIIVKKVESPKNENDILESAQSIKFHSSPTNDESKYNDNIQKFDGLGMLICQAIESFNIWTSSELTVTSIYDEVFKELEKQHD